MNVFAFEWVTGGGLAGEPLPRSLAHEGDLMIRTLLEDLSRVPDVRVRSSRDPRLPPLDGVRVIAPAPGEDGFALYARGLAAADAAWPIAPESGGVLERLARDTLAGGKLLLGSRPAAVRIAASKRATALTLGRAGVAVVPTFGPSDRVPTVAGPWVVKPDDGAGCDGMRLVPDWRAARDHVAASGGRLVAQPWIEGAAASLSLSCAGGRARLLACNRQHVTVTDGRPALTAISVNAVPDSTGRLADLGSRVAAAIPGLRGYVGVDLVLAARGGPVVLEVNPRLTTSYCGLRRALGINVAALVLATLGGTRVERWCAPTSGAVALISLGSADDGD